MPIWALPTEPMMALVLGDTKIPNPIPNTARLAMMVAVPVAPLTKMNGNNPTAVIPMPIVERMRGSFLSDIRPAKGPMTAMTTGWVMRTRPASCGENPFTY